MGLACRRSLLDRDDTLWRLSTTKFERMLRDPANHCLPVFAGQRARMADVIVESGGPRSCACRSKHVFHPHV